MHVTNIVSLCGGLGLFLYGMAMMSEGFEKVAGDRLREWLGILTNKRIIAVLVGAGVTAIIQSSSATTVMVVGFVNASLMTLNQAIGIVMGASIGTTITGYIVALNLTAIAPIFVFFGIILPMFWGNKTVKKICLIVLGFGLLFLGMGMMSSALSPLKNSETFKDVIVLMKNPFLGILAGLVITSIIQSSSAFTGIIIALAAGGLITLESAIPLIIGSNIGTCATALLASINTTTNAKRAAFMHLFYKIIGCAIFLVIMQIVPVAKWLQEILDTPTAQIVAFNTIYNIFNCVVLFPFADKIVVITEKIIKEKKLTDEEEKKLKYIDNVLFDAPTLVVPQITLEVDRMEKMAVKNMAIAINAFEKRNIDKMGKLYKREDVINFLNNQITSNLVRASALDLSDNDRAIVSEFYHIITDIERIGDHAQNIIECVESICENKYSFSEFATQGVIDLAGKVLETIDVCWEAYKKRDLELFLQGEVLEDEVDKLEKALREDHVKRLKKGECDPRSSMLYTDLLGNLERASDHAVNFFTAAQENL